MSAALIQTARSSGTSSSVTMGTAPSSGNVLIAVMVNSVTTVPAVNTAAGWVAIGAGLGGGSGTSRRALICAYKVCGASESTTQTPTTSGSLNVGVAEYSGIDTSASPVDQSSYLLGAASSTQVTNSITPTASADRVIFEAFGQRSAGSVAVYSNELINGAAATEIMNAPTLNVVCFALAATEYSSTSGSYSGQATSSDSGSTCVSGIFGIAVAAVAPTDPFPLGYGYYPWWQPRSQRTLLAR